MWRGEICIPSFSPHPPTPHTPPPHPTPASCPLFHPGGSTLRLLSSGEYLWWRCPPLSFCRHQTDVGIWVAGSFGEERPQSSQGWWGRRRGAEWKSTNYIDKHAWDSYNLFWQRKLSGGALIFPHLFIYFTLLTRHSVDTFSCDWHFWKCINMCVLKFDSTTLFLPRTHSLSFHKSWPQKHWQELNLYSPCHPPTPLANLWLPLSRKGVEV